MKNIGYYCKFLQILQHIIVLIINANDCIFFAELCKK